MWSPALWALLCSSNRHICVLEDTIKEASMVHSHQQSLLGSKGVCGASVPENKGPREEPCEGGLHLSQSGSKPLSFPVTGCPHLVYVSVFSVGETALTTQSLLVRVILTLAMVVCLQFSMVIVDFIDFFRFCSFSLSISCVYVYPNDLTAPLTFLWFSETFVLICSPG